MKIDNNKLYSLEEVAKKICSSYEECEKCPAHGYCWPGHNGALEWLTEKVSEE